MRCGDTTVYGYLWIVELADSNYHQNIPPVSNNILSKPQLARTNIHKTTVTLLIMLKPTPICRTIHIYTHNSFPHRYNIMKLTIFTLLALVSGKVLKLDFERSVVPHPNAPSFAAEPFILPMTNHITLYRAEIQVGTFPQNLYMLVDTGSSDTFVEDNQYYQPNKSSTFKDLSAGTFFVQYGDHSNTSGDWMSDTLSIGGVTIPNQAMGLAEYNSVRDGSAIILGIGLPTLESSVQTLNRTYPNVPESLYLNGDIPSWSYSVYLDSLEATAGSILFGGVDKSKYSGPLHTVPFVTPNRFDVTISSINIKSETTNKTVNVLNVPGKGNLDTGTVSLWLPHQTFLTILKDWKVDKDPDYGYIIPEYRLHQLQNEYLEFNFQGIIIKVSASELFTPKLTGDGTNTAQYPNGQKAYSPLIKDGGNSTQGLVLGDSFLRSAYVVYDLANQEASLAQADYSGNDAQVEEIQAGEDVPGATRVKDYDSVYSNVPISTTVCYQPTEYTLNPRPAWLN